jgi:23S rRNA (adenine1618-N6)-methyltransferase
MLQPRSHGTIRHAAGRPHPRNQHGERYAFDRLIRACPELASFVVAHPAGGDTIDFSDPVAVKTLNRALLKDQYGVEQWDIPPGYLCPPIPSRADYVHHVADLLSDGEPDNIPRGSKVRIFDVGVGANCVYPIIGSAEYQWRFVGSDIDPVSIEWARRLIATNRILRRKLECRLQRSSAQIFAGVIGAFEHFEASMCNPPFHASAQEAAGGTLRKLKNLGRATGENVVLNFGGKSNELWCDGGEAGFIQRLIAQSARVARQFLWFTTLVSKRGSLPAIYRKLKTVEAAEVRTVAMAQGQKQSRMVAWTFLSPTERSAWRERFKNGKEPNLSTAAQLL